MNIFQTFMRCVYTAGSIRTESIESVNLDRPEIRFKACNVNENGEEISRGEIQLTDSDLTFYRPGMFPIRWPISSIRRYGCDDNQFSFESGRCSPTGSGIFAFKVDRGSDLINMLRENIEKAGLQDQDLFHDSPSRNQNNRPSDRGHATAKAANTKSVNSTMTNTDDQNLVEFSVGQHRRPCQQITDNPTQTIKRDIAANVMGTPACDAKLASTANTKDASTSTDDTITRVSKDEVKNIIPNRQEIDTKSTSNNNQLKEDLQPADSSYAIIDFESTKALEVSAASHAATRQEVSK